MSNRIRGALAAAFALLCVSVPGALAAPASVNVRVEGITDTIFEGPVTTDGHKTATQADNGTLRDCDGTYAGNPAGPTAASALDDAARLAGFTWDGPWDGGFNEYLIRRIAADAVDSSHYWSLWINSNYAQSGGCGQRVNAGDEVLWAYEDFDPVSVLLELSAPTTARTGEPVRVGVIDAFDGSPEEGATVAGVPTAADGQATLTFTEPGIHRLKAQKPGTIRSNAVVLCVDPPGADPCTSADRVAPSLSVALPGERLASERGRSRTLLVSWQADDSTGAGVAYYSVDVREAANGLRGAKAVPGDWRAITPRTTLSAAHFRGESGHAYQFRVTAVDRAANRAAVETDPIVLPVDDRDRGLWRFSRGWKRARARAAWGRTVMRAEEAGASATLRFSGRSVSLIGRRLRKGGQLRVTTDGRSRVLKLAGRGRHRSVLWTSRKLGDGDHVLRIRSLGGGPVEVDAVAPQP